MHTHTRTHKTRMANKSTAYACLGYGVCNVLFYPYRFYWLDHSNCAYSYCKFFFVLVFVVCVCVFCWNMSSYSSVSSFTQRCLKCFFLVQTALYYATSLCLSFAIDVAFFLLLVGFLFISSRYLWHIARVYLYFIFYRRVALHSLPPFLILYHILICVSINSPFASNQFA